MDDLTRQGARVRVLLVEDSAHDAMLIAEMLRAAWPDGFVLSHAATLADATQELFDHGASCVLLGLRRGSGIDPLEHVITNSPDIPVVALSDDGDERDALRAVAAGAQDLLIKADLNAKLLRRAISLAIERKRSEVQLAQQALHDPLTGLPNRALFLDRLGVALDRSRRTSASVAVLFLDVDNFKEVNDTLGHAAGDRVLVGLADRLRGMLRPMDTVARFGGDEFTFLFEELSSEREVVLIAERISRAASTPLDLDGTEVTITVSIGIAMVGDPSTPPDTVIREADAAMYRAKELGRSRYELFDEASRSRAMERLELEAALRLVVERSELRVFYQPKVSLDDRGEVSGFEALVRWQHPERGLLAPAQFLPLAEETGLVLQIGEYVIEQALQQLVHWRSTNPEVTISVNLSVRQLEDTGLVAMLARAIRSRGAQPSGLALELTEGALNHDLDVSTRVLEGLKAVGVGLTIDDYGTGYSSLQRLKSLPFDTLKIDGTLIGELGRNPEQTPIVGAIVELAHALGLRVVAEHVERDEQLSELRALGCDWAQGHLFGAAASAEEAEAWLSPTGGLTP
jgi:diguanylate cyclase (GGDEF)-like protein